MKFFVKSHNPTMDPRSRGFLDSIVGILDDNGIKENTPKALCSREMLNISIRMMKGLEANVRRNKDTNEYIRGYTEQMKVVLNKYGVANTEVQEQIVVDFFAALEKARMG
jgi:hypothetical protein